MSRTDYKTRTEGQTINIITWTLPDFITLLENKTTREFRTENNSKEPTKDLSESRWQLKMQFLGMNNDIIEFYYLSPTPVYLKLTMCNEVNNGHFGVSDNHFSAETGYHNIQANKWQYFTTLFKKDLLRNICYKLNEGDLKLKFKFMFINNIKVDSCNVSETQLSNDFEYLLNNGLFSDVTMKSAEQVEYKVHKLVLASRSAVLKAHFEHNTTECHTNVVESPLESEVLREVLTFIYSDKAPRVDEIPEKLLAAAEYYQLSRLKNLCEEALYKKLTVENAIETLQLADLHSANALKQSTLEFIKDGQAKLITKTEGWGKMKSVELVKRICECLVTDDRDADIE